MSSASIVKLAMGYEPTAGTPDCSSCAHAEPEPRPGSWHCEKGGFVTNSNWVCARHRAAAPIAIGPTDV